MKSLSKSDELKELQKFAKKMQSCEGGSYIGDWLGSIFPQIESLLKSDIIPDCTPQDGIAACEAMKAQCENECLALYAKAEKAFLEADRYGDEVQEKLRFAIGQSIKQLEKVQWGLFIPKH